MRSDFPVRKAVFPVAGFGTRFLPATKAMPKELLPIIDKPIIQYAVEEAVSAGIETMIFVTGRNKRAVGDHFDTNLELEAALAAKGKEDAREMVRNIVPPHVNCLFVRQPEPLGLGHAVWCARAAVGNEPFAVLLADDLMRQRTGSATADLIATYAVTGHSVISVAEVAPDEVSKYGILAPGAGGTAGPTIEAAGLVEKPDPDFAPSNFASFGRYVLTPDIFDILGRIGRGAGNEIQLADAINTLAALGQVTARVFQGTRFDCGDKLGYLQAVISFALDDSSLGPRVESYLSALGFDRRNRRWA